jgi:hypothetical protein
MLHRTRQYKIKILEWGLNKCLSKSEAQAILQKRRQRITEGKKNGFEFRGQQIEPAKLERAQKSFGIFNNFAIKPLIQDDPTIFEDKASLQLTMKSNYQNIL